MTRARANPRPVPGAIERAEEMLVRRIHWRIQFRLFAALLLVGAALGGLVVVLTLGLPR